MATGTMTIVIPIRAFWWLKKLAVNDHRKLESYLLSVLLQHLEAHIDVDLSRTPSMEE